jgi:hypothetical protein
MPRCLARVSGIVIRKSTKPTLIAGIVPPTRISGVQQKPIEATSMLYTFDKANANTGSKHTKQYFEIVANRVGTGIGPQIHPLAHSACSLSPELAFQHDLRASSRLW